MGLYIPAATGVGGKVIFLSRSACSGFICGKMPPPPPLGQASKSIELLIATEQVNLFDRSMMELPAFSRRKMLGGFALSGIASSLASTAHAQKKGTPPKIRL